MTEQEALQMGRAAGADRNGNPRLRAVAFAVIVVSVGAMATQARAASDVPTKGVCNKSPAATQALDRLEDVMWRGRFVAYEPTSLQVVNGRPTRADAAGIRADLQVLRSRFNGLIT